LVLGTPSTRGSIGGDVERPGERFENALGHMMRVVRREFRRAFMALTARRRNSTS
jgi:hypothetical protein